MKLIMVVAVASLFVKSSPAYAVTWIYVVSDDFGTAHYYDADTIQRSGDKVTFWIKSDHSRDKTLRERETKSRSRYDCTQRTRTLLNLTSYYPDGTNKSFAFGANVQEENPIAPGTSSELILEAVCAATTP